MENSANAIYDTSIFFLCYTQSWFVFILVDFWSQTFEKWALFLHWRDPFLIFYWFNFFRHVYKMAFSRWYLQIPKQTNISDTVGFFYWGNKRYGKCKTLLNLILHFYARLPSVFYDLHFFLKTITTHFFGIVEGLLLLLCLFGVLGNEEC